MENAQKSALTFVVLNTRDLKEHVELRAGTPLRLELRQRVTFKCAEGI